MSSPRFLILLLVFSSSAFVWWIYLLLDLNQRHSTDQLNMLQMGAFEAEATLCQLNLPENSRNGLQLIKVGTQHLYVDTLAYKRFTRRFPGILFRIDRQRLFISPAPEEISRISKNHRTRYVWMVAEGCVFFSLLITGYVSSYRGFLASLSLTRQQNNFLLSVTHELKTPVSSIQLMLQTLEKHTLGRERREELIRYGITDTRRLNELVENILLATRIEGESYSYSYREILLSGWLLEEIEKYRRVFGSGYRFYLIADNTVKAMIDIFSFKLVLHNLLENAMKYSSPGSAITIRLEGKESHAELSVEDEGIGIKAWERKKVFARFYRSGDEAIRKTKGTGLGLYIVKEVVRNHKGTVSIEENEPKGSIFNIRIPKT
jgi:two-component system phosphate regulon sensor histidine kinase PhoR